MRDTATSPYRNDLLVRAKTKQSKTDQDIAEEAGVSRPTVAAILSGATNVRLESIIAVGKALGVDPFAKAA